MTACLIVDIEFLRDAKIFSTVCFFFERLCVRERMYVWEFGDMCVSNLLLSTDSTEKCVIGFWGYVSCSY